MQKWEFGLTVAITLIIAAELGFAWAGFYDSKDQYKPIATSRKEKIPRSNKSTKATSAGTTNTKR